MPRRARSIVGGYAYHVLNRANGRLRLFKKQADFAAFERNIAEASERVTLRRQSKGPGLIVVSSFPLSLQRTSH